MAGFTDIRQAVQTKLETVSSLAYAYPYLRDVVEGYPSAVFDITNNDNTVLTNCENQREYSWGIYVLQETKNLSTEDAGAILDTVSDEIVNAFETDKTLGGLVDWTEPMTGSRDEVDTPQGLCIMQTLVLRVVVRGSALPD
jgi:hypothetical protein